MKLLDTTFLVDVLRKREEALQVIQEMEAAEERRATTEVNAFELLVGVHRRGRAVPSRLEGARAILDRLDVLPLERAGASLAADVLAKLRADGKDIGILDALVAGIALASGYDTIVSRGESFQRVPGLRVQSY